MKGTILVMEDDANTREALKRTLEVAGYEVTAASDGVKGLAKIKEQTFGVVVLDRSMPNMDGLAVCEKMRAMGDRTPVLFLSAKGEVDSRVEGLEVGGDDYLAKPFESEELLARVKALLRRNLEAEGTSDTPLKFADLELNPKTRTVTRANTEINLTKLEFELLEIFLINRELVLTKEDLYEKIWGAPSEYENRSLDTHIKNLRKKIEAENQPRLIHTIRGVGYALKRTG